MNHRFLLGHHEFVPPEGGRTVNPNTLERVQWLLQRRLQLPRLIFGTSNHEIARSVMLMHVWLQEHMEEHQGLPAADQHLLSAVLLHRLVQHLDHTVQHPRLRIYQCARAGNLLLRELTLLLLKTHPHTHQSIVQVGFLSGMNQTRWHEALIGASGEAYTLKSLAARPGARVFLPTPVEDMRHATDLFWFEGRHRFAVSVKTQSSKEAHVAVRCITRAPNGTAKYWPHSHLDAIWQGCKIHSSSFGRRFTAVAVQVSIQDRRPACLDRRWTDVKWPNNALDHADRHAA